MAKQLGTSTKRVTVSLDAELLDIVDDFVKASKAEDISRSSVFEEALRLWRQSLRDQQDILYFSKNAKALEEDNKSWSRITKEAAKHIWK